MAFPNPGVTIDPSRTALVVTDPQNDFLSPEGATWGLVGENVIENGTIENMVAPDLPEGIIGPVVNDEFGDVYGTIITVTGEGYSYAELKDVADDVRDELLRIDEVAKVDIFGAQEERVFVEYNNARLAEVGISPFQLRAILESRNIIIPGGAITTSAERIALEPSGNFESVDDLRRSVIHLPGSNDIIAVRTSPRCAADMWTHRKP